MAELSAEARIRDLKRRLELDPSSRLFVTLAEEYRKSGRLADALSTLQKGMLAHPGYISAQVALGRAYLEAGQITEAIATFSKVLANDPGNLVSAKSLADIYLSRGESVEAIKKYKLYRALSGDRSVDEIVVRLQEELAPPPPPKAEPVAVPPPPTFFSGKVSGPMRTSREIQFAEKARAPRPDTVEMSSLPFELDESTMSRKRELEPFPVLSRDTAAPRSGSPATEPAPPAWQAPPALAAAPAPPEAPVAPAPPPPPFAAPAMAASEDVVTRALRVADVLAAAPYPETLPGIAAMSPFALPSPEPARAVEPAPTAPAAEPQGRTLGDLYFAQGHYAEALRIYDDLVAANPSDPELMRLRRDAEARLLPAASARGAAEPDAGLNRRLARIRALKRWLSVVQIG